MNSMLEFVLSHKPNEWENIDYDENSYEILDVDLNSPEYINIRALFDSTTLDIKSIKRVQNPYQYGRFKLKQEMTNNKSEETVFYVVYRDELETALKFTCDYRRLRSSSHGSSYNKQPYFFTSVSEAISRTAMPGFDVLFESDKNILVLSKITGTTTTQSDYYVRYVVDFNQPENKIIST